MNRIWCSYQPYDSAAKAVDDEDEFLRDNANLANLDNDIVDLEFKVRYDRAKFLPRKLRIIQKRWKKLYDAKAHTRLQCAVKNELHCWHHNNDGAELADINPSVDLYDSYNPLALLKGYSLDCTLIYLTLCAPWVSPPSFKVKLNIDA